MDQTHSRQCPFRVTDNIKVVSLAIVNDIFTCSGCKWVVTLRRCCDKIVVIIVIVNIFNGVE